MKEILYPTTAWFGKKGGQPLLDPPFFCIPIKNIIILANAWDTLSENIIAPPPNPPPL